MAGKICEMLHLCGQLTAAVAAVLEEPSCDNSRAVQHKVRAWPVAHTCSRGVL